jgi:hypothetical protein
VSACPVCGIGPPGPNDHLYGGTGPSHLSCVEKQAKALEASASLEGDYSEAQEFIRSLQREAAFWKWLCGTDHPNGFHPPWLAHMRERFERGGR